MIDQSQPWQLYFDGLCEPVNPGGVIAYGVILVSPDGDSTPLSGIFDAVQGNTNNRAEWCALGMGLAWLLKILESRTGASRNVQIFGDSKLTINQFTGAWKCNHPYLAKMRERCKQLAKVIAGESGSITAKWIPRDQNTEADALGRKAYFEATGKTPIERQKREASKSI